MIESRQLVGYRPHPVFRTLVQEIYECGHAMSVRRRVLVDSYRTAKRCVKCAQQLPPDIEAVELAVFTGRSLEGRGTLKRLYDTLAFHIGLTELALANKELKESTQLDAEVREAYAALAVAGRLLRLDGQHTPQMPAS
ncbi:MAG: hypothetical protein JSW10_06590 [Pseudomonadota bacterium]|nr:MAG: hypothetical protein JSW10_06590 [Pseudomonadota bacterium]